MTIDLPTGFYKPNDGIFKARSIELREGFSVLVGCNGTGKTTFLKNLECECKKKNIAFFLYDNLHNGGHSAISKLDFDGSYSKIARNFMSSEGENVSNNFADMVKTIGAFVAENVKNGLVVLAFDALDSGSSIDNIVEFKKLFTFILKTEREIVPVYIIAAANSYELASGEQCIDVTNGRYITFGDYNEYRDFILKSREIKNERYERTNATNGK